MAPTGAASTSAAVSAAIIVYMIGGVSKLKGLELGEESLNMGLHHVIVLISGSAFGGVLCGCGCTFVLVNLEAHHLMVHDGVGVVEDQFVYCSSGFSEFKVSFTELMFKIFACFYTWLVRFARPDVVFDNKGEVYYLTLS